MIRISSFIMGLFLLVAFSGISRADADAEFNFAMGLFEKKEYKLVQDELVKFIQNNPTYAKIDLAYFYLGECYYRQEKFRDAAPTLEKYVKGYPKSKYHMEGMYQLGRAYFSINNFKSAATWFATFNKSYPDGYLTDASYFWLAEAQYRQKLYVESIQTYTAFLDKYKKSDYRANAIYGCAWAFADNKEPAKAAHMFVMLSNSFPKHAQAQESLYLAAEQYYAAGQFEKALPLYRACAEKGNADDLAAKSLYAAGWVLSETGKHINAANEFALLAKSYPQSSLANESAFLEGYNYYKGNSFAKALASLSSLSKQPGAVGHGKVHYWIGMTQVKQSQSQQALQSFNASLASPDLAKDLKPRVMFDKASLLYEMKQYPQVVALAKQFAQGFGKHELADEMLYQSILASDAHGDFKTGMADLAVFKTSYATSPLMTSALFAEGKFLFETKDYEKAVATYQQFMAGVKEKSDPRLATASSKIALAYYKMGKSDQAKQQFASILKQHPKSDSAAEAVFMEGKINYDLKSFKPALSLFAKLEKGYPGNPYQFDALLLAGACHLELGEKEKALSSFKRVIDHSKSDALKMQAMLYCAEAAYQSKQLASAASFYQQYLAKYPNGAQRSEVFHGLGVVNYNLKQYDEAINNFTKLNEIKDIDASKRSESLYLIGRCYEMKGKFDDATSFYQKSVNEYPKQKYASQSQYRIIGCLYKAKKYKACVDAANRYLQAGDDAYKPAALYDRAWAYEGMGDKKASIADFKTFLQKYPDHKLASEVGMKVGELLYYAHDYEKAVAHYDRVIALNVDTLLDKAWYKKGCAYEAMKKPADAQQSFETLLQKYPQSTLAQEVHYRLGEIHYNAKSMDKALNHFEATLKGNKEISFYEKALLGRAEVHHAKGKLKPAMADYQLHIGTYTKSRDRSRAFCGLGRCQQALGAYNDAIKTYNLATAGQTGESAARAQLGKGQCLKLLKRYDDAVKELLKVTILYGFDHWAELAVYEIGHAYHLKGDVAKRSEYLNSYLRKFPNGQKAEDVRKLLKQ